MFAIVDILGKQFCVSEGQIVLVPKIKSKKVGEEVEFDKVICICDEESTILGSPYLENKSVTAVISKENVKGVKNIIFKKKRRKNFQRKRGHRQCYTEISIKKIN